jgi:hypothetical protein
LSSTLKNQLSFNKMIETQLAQIAASFTCCWEREDPGATRDSCWKCQHGVHRMG